MSSFATGNDENSSAQTSDPNCTTNNGSYNFIEKALECPLCLSLICEPLSISCGHSFCRVCLVKSLRRSKKKCPQCRAVCHISAEDAHENFMIKGLAINSNPAEYAARLLESETEKSSWMTLLPIFYYNETLFPGSRLDLHLFEPRYRVMMQRVVNSTRSFAYVPNFNQYRANVGDVALVAVLEEVEFMADGRCMLQAKLSSRMVITEHYVEEGTQGLHFCRLVPLVDSPIDPSELNTVTQLIQVATQIIGTLFSSAIRALEERYGPVPPASGPEAFSLWMAAMCPLSGREKARLLASTDTAERLRTVVGYLSDATARRMTSVTAATTDAVTPSADAEVAAAAASVAAETDAPRRRRNARRQPVRRLREAGIAGQTARGEISQLNSTEGVDMETDEDARGDEDDNDDDDEDDDEEMDAVAAES